MPEMGSFKLSEFTKEEIVLRFAITLFWPQSYFPVQRWITGSFADEGTKSHKPSVINANVGASIEACETHTNIHSSTRRILRLGGS